MKFITVLTFLFFFSFSLQAQEENVSGFFFGPKLGPTLGFQNWNGTERNAMINYHFAAFIESIDPDYNGALYAQLGLHSRGSGINVVSSITNFRANQAFVFRNISFQAGAKKRLLTNSLKTPYYFVGLRLEYQLSNNLQEVQERYFGSVASLYYPLPDFVNKWTYGLSFGGGIEFLGSEYVQPVVEVSISPDIAFQYQSQTISGITNPYNGQPTTLPERRIRNLSLEISLVVRFMRKVIYTD
ncbi:MAG: hypothetical protein HKO66_04105 [Saprospiraceae bacterium]|nr:hypothetical protein [Bacteroidia bacterium]NNE15611.1 hypothetical protein [Saprospiraceae bacterium]NNL91394.1 hypothetical protein [Saprospiraceae bacterium]